MNIITIVMLGFGAFAVLMGGVFWFFTRTKGSGKKFPFLLYNKDGSLARKIEAKIRVDQENRSRKLFVFEDNDTKLPIKPPSIHIGSVGYRQITMGNRGEFVYLDKLSINDEKYLKTVMESEDIAVFTSMIIDNNREFQNPMAKTTAALVIGMAVIALIIMIGTIYATITLVNNSKDMAAIAKENSETVAGLKAVAETNAAVSEQLTAVAAALTGDINLTRRLE